MPIQNSAGIITSSAADVVNGTDASDTVRAGSGNDTVKGGEGNDVVYGGHNRDRLLGEGGDDFLNGDSSNDKIIGGTGADTIVGGGGDDILYGGLTNQRQTGIFDDATDTDVFVFGRADGNDKVWNFQDGIDTIVLEGSNGSDYTVTAFGGGGSQITFGSTVITVFGIKPADLMDDIQTAMP